MLVYMFLERRWIMKKSIITAIRWIWIACGIASAVTGIVVPTLANETNNACWIFVFLACAPYPEKQ